MFRNFVVYMLVQEMKKSFEEGQFIEIPIILHRTPDATCAYVLRTSVRNNRLVRSLERCPQASVDLLADRFLGMRIFNLVDVMKGDLGSVAHLGYGKTILFSSPNKNLSEQRKQDTSAFCMPTWSRAEIDECERNCAHLTRVCADAFELYGGVPRVVFGRMQGAQRRIEDIVSTMSPCDICRQETALGKMDDSPAVSHRLLHYHLRTGECTTLYEKYDYDWATLQWGTPHLLGLVVDRYLEGVGEVANGLFEDWSGLGQSVAGSLFEAVAHRMILGGSSLTCTRLGRGKRRCLPKEFKFEGGADSVEQFDGDVPLATYSSGKYYRPTSGTFPVIDSYCVQDGCVIAFQMTVAGSHDIENTAAQLAVIDGLEALAAVVGNEQPAPAKSRRKNRKAESAPVAIVFFVPASLSGGFKMQKVWAELYPDVQQYVVARLSSSSSS
jgi:hypothetical protein